MGFVTIIFVGSLFLFYLLGSISGGLFLSYLAAALAYRIVQWKITRHKGRPIDWREIRDIIAGLNAYKFFDKQPEQKELWSCFKYTLGAAFVMASILHIYLIPLLMTDALGLRMTSWWMEFTDPVLGWLGGLSVSVRHFTRDLITLGYPERILIVRHVHGVVFLCLIVFTLGTLLNFRRIAHAPIYLARAAAAQPQPHLQSLGGKVRIFGSWVFLIFLSCVFAYLSIRTVFFRDRIKTINSWEELKTTAPLTMFGGTVHVDNAALLDIAWLGPLVTHGVILSAVLVCLTTVVFIFERRRLRVAN